MKTIGPIAAALAIASASLCAFPSLASAKNFTESWVVYGLHNAVDVRHVRDALAHVPGVSQVSVTQATASLTLDSDRVSDAQLEAAVAHAGDYRLVRHFE